MTDQLPRCAPPAPALDVPDVVRNWAKGRCDRAIRRSGDGSVTLTRFEPGEVLEARFKNAIEAAEALATEVKWQAVQPLPRGRNFGQRRGRAT